MDCHHVCIASPVCGVLSFFLSNVAESNRHTFGGKLTLVVLHFTRICPLNCCLFYSKCLLFDFVLQRLFGVWLWLIKSVCLLFDFVLQHLFGVWLWLIKSVWCLALAYQKCLVFGFGLLKVFGV